MKRIFRPALTAALVFTPALTSSAFAADQAQIDAAIQRGLAWLATQQNLATGGFGVGYELANTATSVLAFENEGHFPGGGGLYSFNVERGLDYVFARGAFVAITPQIAGNPDSNGNGLGIYFNQSSYMYETGLVMQAIVASNTPTRLVTVGPLAGLTYQQVMQEVVDFLAYAQIDGGPGRGGWRYGVFNNSSGYGDNSVAQWPVLGLVAAQQWGITAPAWVKSEMEFWVTYIQNMNGGSGYETPNSIVNVAKTGGLLVEFYYLGDERTTPRAAQAIHYLDTNWNIGLSSWDGNKGHPYAMFSVFKGLELMQVPSIPNAPATPDTPAGDWWGDYSDYLVGTQSIPAAGLGFWGGYYYWGQYLATPWNIVILQASVFPVSVDVVVPGAACDLTGYEVDVHYSVERFTATGTLSIYRDEVLFDALALIDFIGSGSWIYDATPETLGSHVWRAVLQVTGGGITTQAEDTDDTLVYATPQVAGIPDQVAPFTPFDLDAFQTCECPDVDWTVTGVPSGWTVDIDVDHVVTVAAPAGEFMPAALTFTAVFHWPTILCEDSDTAMFLPNRPPVAHPGRIYPDEEYEVAEGGSVTVDGTLSYDPDGDAIVLYEWDLDGDGIFEMPGAVMPCPATGYDGPSEYYIYLRVWDEHGAWDIALAELEVENVAPNVDAMIGPIAPVAVGTPVVVNSLFSDPCPMDTHVSFVAWGDGTVEPMHASTSPVLDSHAYMAPGFYDVWITVTDDDGGVGQSVLSNLVVYDPEAGFVTGGGWIQSPAGAYPANPSFTGKANFGLVAKYKRGESVPAGQTEFQVADLNFHSASYEWLVVLDEHHATYRGMGRVNGVPGYHFQVWTGDEPDAFRIRIWTEDSAGAETVVYDNASDLPLGGGSIVIHR